MVPFQIKICGVTSVADAIQACECGADAIGLNFFPKSSRFVDRETAQKIVGAIRQWSKPNLQSVKIIGVVVNLPTSELMRLLSDVRLDGIQLHGDESTGQVSALRTEIAKESLGEGSVLLIRAIRAESQSHGTEQASGQVARIQAEIERWVAAGVDAVLLDAAVPGEYGGTGETVDWPAVPSLDCQVPLVLAGGLNAENVRVAINTSQAKSVDVASGVEAEPGKKDGAKLRDFIASARNAF